MGTALAHGNGPAAQAFFITARPVASNDFIYYSFVTLTTVGYGDITPVSPPARTLSWLEAMMGQFYIAVLVAFLVGIRISQGLVKSGETSSKRNGG